MLTLWSDRTECLWEESLPVEVKQLPDDLAALDRVLSDPRLLGPIVARWRREFSRDGPVGVDRRAPDDRDGDLYPVDGAQGALPLGVSVGGGGGVGLDSLAPVLPDLFGRAARGWIDSTVIEADVKYPTDSGRASHGVRVLQAIAAALARGDLSAGERLVAFSLASFADRENRAWPGAPAAGAGLRRSRYLEAREQLVRAVSSS